MATSYLPFSVYLAMSPPKVWALTLAPQPLPSGWPGWREQEDDGQSNSGGRDSVGGCRAIVFLPNSDCGSGRPHCSTLTDNSGSRLTGPPHTLRIEVGDLWKGHQAVTGGVTSGSW
ncbi:hypothetical protein C8J57DRAFT_1227992 [Mycena rebaudengoi]|nr:hypothetical protein C8J57DRAFT_1227992 [Mycena rebaudengoi]